MQKTTLNAQGLLCPLPVLKAKKRLASLDPSDVLELVSDDPASVKDVPLFCEQSGHTLLEQTATEAGAFVYLIQKRAATA